MVTRMVREPWSLPELGVLRHTPGPDRHPNQVWGGLPSRDQMFYQCSVGSVLQQSRYHTGTHTAMSVRANQIVRVFLVLRLLTGLLKRVMVRLRQLF